MVISKELDANVRQAIAQGYSEHQVARMYNLRVGAVRAILLEFQREVSATGRYQQQPLDFGRRIHEGLFREMLNEASVRYRKPNSILKQDFVGLEAHVLSGFFTTEGQPTPAFWGYVNQYVKKSGHTLLDILHDKEIYAPEQLERALDIDSQIQDMTQAQRIALLRRLTNAVYSDEFKDPTDPGSNVQDSE